MKGMLFKPESIQAIPEGRKTQTRRVIKPQPDLGLPEFDRYSHITVGKYHPTKIDKEGEEYAGDEIFGAYTDDGEWGWKCPYPVGETVYLKETYWADLQGGVWGYKSDMEWPSQNCAGKGVSALFMPEWAARYFVKIVAVRAERLQEITYGDCIAEGLDMTDVDYIPGWDISKFKSLWDSINKDYQWESNPWVWVYTFRLEVR